MEAKKCPHYGVCGGCSLQHVPYQQQLERKKDDLRRVFGREPDETIPSPKIWYYRNRMDYAVSGRLEVGLRVRGKWWAYVDIVECLLQSPESNIIRNAFREFLKSRGIEGYDTRRHKGLVRYLVIREGKFTGERMVAIVTSRPVPELFKDFTGQVGVRVDSWLNGVNPGLFDTSRSEETLVIAGKHRITEKLLGYAYEIGLNSFFQTNSYTAERILEIVLEEARGSKRVYDLYSGVGTFTVPLAEVAEEAYGVESDSESVEIARRNAEINSSSASFFTARVESLGRIDADTVVLDPPRGGVHPKALRVIASSEPRKIVYVACNPRKQAEDVKKLRNYRLERLVFVDQFPHTPHIETIVVLTRS